MDQEFMRFLASLGVGGALAAFIYYYQRKDAIRHAEEWKGQAQLFSQLVVNNTIAMTKVVESSDASADVVKENTRAVDALRNELQDRRTKDRQDPPHQHRRGI
jgi:hypothetical protein